MVDAILFAAHMAVGREIVGVVVVGVGRVPRMEAQLQPLKLKLKKVRPTPSGPTVPCSPAQSTGPSQRCKVDRDPCGFHVALNGLDSQSQTTILDQPSRPKIGSRFPIFFLLSGLRSSVPHCHLCGRHYRRNCPPPPSLSLPPDHDPTGRALLRPPSPPPAPHLSGKSAPFLGRPQPPALGHRQARRQVSVSVLIGMSKSPRTPRAKSLPISPIPVRM